jgi:hypothetical protein
VLGVSAVKRVGEGENMRVVPSSFSNVDDIITEVEDGIGAFGGEVNERTGRTTAGPVALFISDDLPPGQSGGNTDGWAMWAGTSFASPVVAAFAACVWSVKPDLPAISRIEPVPGRPPRDLLGYIVQGEDDNNRDYRDYLDLFQEE